MGYGVHWAIRELVIRYIAHDTYGGLFFLSASARRDHRDLAPLWLLHFSCLTKSCLWTSSSPVLLVPLFFCLWDTGAFGRYFFSSGYSGIWTCSEPISSKMSVGCFVEFQSAAHNSTHVFVCGRNISAPECVWNINDKLRNIWRGWRSSKSV